MEAEVRVVAEAMPTVVKIRKWMLSRARWGQCEDISPKVKEVSGVIGCTEMIWS